MLKFLFSFFNVQDAGILTESRKQAKCMRDFSDVRDMKDCKYCCGRLSVGEFWSMFTVVH